MSILTYNNVTLPYAFTTSFNQEAVYEQSNTDWILTKFDITSQGVLNTAYLPIVAPDLVVGGLNIAQNAADIMSVIRSRLLKPRQALSMTFNGTQLIPRDQQSLHGTVDAKNGPQPQYCNIIQLTNDTFLFTYRIIANYWENNQVNTGGVATSTNPIITNQAGGKVLVNRWTEEVDMDATMTSKRTRKGKFTIRSDNIGLNIADELRTQMAVQGVPTGFIRTNQHYAVSEDGLTLEYALVDQEVYKIPPQPAYEAEGDYIESTGSGGNVRYGAVRVLLRGCPSENVGGIATGQAALTEAAMGVGMRKLRAVGFGPTANIRSASLRVSLYKNEVEFQAKALLQGGRNRINAILLGIPPVTWVNVPNRAMVPALNNNLDLVTTPGSDTSLTPPIYDFRGTAHLLLRAAAYNNPSLDKIVNLGGSNDGQLSTGIEVGKAGNTPGV